MHSQPTDCGMCQSASLRQHCLFSQVGLCRLHGDIKPAGHDQDKAGQNPSLDELSKEDVKAHKEEMKNMGSGTKPFISEPPAPAMSSADHNSGARKT